MQNDPEETEEPLELPAEPAEGEEDTTDWKAEAQKLRDKAIAQRERTKGLKEQLKEAKGKVDAPKAEPTKTDELDETQLDYLDLKGISEPDDIKVIESIVKRTGMTVRQALKDEYVVSKLEANKAQRDVKAAMPSSTKRSGSGGGNDLATALAKYEQAGFAPEALPTDFKLRIAVVNAVSQQTKSNKPAWH